jgi:asparagine synthase (glutamine-hydrolysing)
MERDLYWDPLRVAAVDPLEDAAEAAALLRQAVRRCVQAWAGGHDSIVHTLSGGLDSAIVLACLADAPNRPRITCVNYHSPGANSDERIFARLMADHAGPGTGCALIERERDPSIRLQALLQAPRSAYPVNCRYYLENSAWEAAFTRERQATAIFCGEGGDQLFYQARARFAAGDYLCRRGRARGLGKGLLRVALDAARLDRLSLWTVLGDALGQAWLGRRWDIEQDLRRFRKLAPAGVLARVMGDARIRHPAFQHPPHAIAGGKRWHAYQLLFPAMDFYDPLGSIQDAERITPLSSQPVLELCLRTPVDVLTAGGWDRAVARRAFRQDLPRAIVLRRSKGGLDAYFKRVLLENMDFARPFLLEGQLAAAGLVDRDRLRTALSDTPNRIGANTTELFDCVNLEAWLRRWHGG